MVGKALSGALRLIFRIWKPIIFLIGFALIIAFTVMWILSIISFFFTLPYTDYFLADSPFASILGFTNIFLLISIPLFGMVLFAGRMFFGRRVSPRFRAGLSAVWVVNLISFFAIGSYTGREFNQGAKLEQSLPLNVKGDTLRIGMLENEYKDAIFSMGSLQVAEDRLIDRNINFSIQKANGPAFELIQYNNARGRTIEEANKLASLIDYTPQVKEGKIALLPYFSIQKGEKWRAQQIDLVLKVPEGKSIYFDNYNGYYNDHIKIDRSKAHPWISSDQTWKMETNGLVCNEYRQKNNYDRDLSYTDFNHLIIEGQLEVKVQQGDEYEVQIEGSEHYASKIDFNQMGQTLTISANQNWNYRGLRLLITMPQLKEVDMENTNEIKIQGFQEPSMTIRYEGRHDLKALVDVDSLEVRQSGRGTVDLRGKGKFMKVVLDEGARFDADHFRVNRADIVAKRNTKANLDVIEHLTKQVSPNARIEVNEDVAITEVKKE